MEVIVIGQMDNTIDNTFESANRIYSIDGISPTIPTCGGGGIQPKILETKKIGVIACFAMDGSDNFGLKPNRGGTVKPLRQAHTPKILREKDGEKKFYCTNDR